MKLIATDQGRILQLMVMEELRPVSGFHVPSLVEAIKARYQFAQFPLNYSQDVTKGVEFKGGLLYEGEETITIEEMGLYNDGIIIASRNTHYADTILNDLMNWATTNFKLRELITPYRKTYTSLVVVEFDKPIDSAIRSFSAISDLSSEMLKKSYNHEVMFNVQNLSFNSDPTTLPPYTNTQFAIERRLDVSYASNRFYSTAPLTTDMHLDWLAAVESLLGE